MSHPLDPLFRPRSVAIIGASSDPNRIGGRPVRVFQARLQGRDRADQSEPEARSRGCPPIASIKDVPGAIDQAIIAVPAKAAMQAADDCIAKGVKAAVMFSSGFAETGAEGRAHADRARAALRGGRHEAARAEQPRHVQRPRRALLDLLVLLRSALAAHRAGRHRQPERRVRHLFPRARGRARARLFAISSRPATKPTSMSPNASNGSPTIPTPA